MYKILKSIIISDTIPQNPDILWLRPIGNGYAFYVWKNGSWKPVEIINTQKTAGVDDDTVIDVENIPSMETLENKIEEEVSSQMTEHDIRSNDTHNTESGSQVEYPEVII